MNATWVCPKCNREFNNTNQNHYCIEAPTAIDEYIASQPEERRETLSRVRETISACAPNAIEKIAWRMPTFWQGENLVHFCAFKNHLGFYPGDSGVRVFEERLKAGGYKYSKGAIQFPWNSPVPYELIAEITSFRVREAEGRVAGERQDA